MMMTDVSLDDLGPVDYLIVEFPAGASNFTGEMAAELRALVDSGIIRVIDVLILTKHADGTVEATELSDVGELGELQAIEAGLGELLAEDDVEHLAAAMEPGSTAGVLIWENLWAAPFPFAGGGAEGEVRPRPPRVCQGAGKHGRSAHLGEPVGRAIRISGAAFGWPADRQRADPHPGDHRLDRGRRSNCDRRRLKMPLRPARVGRVGVIRAPVAKTAVVAAAVTPGRGAPVAKTAVVAAAVTPRVGRRRI